MKNDDEQLDQPIAYEIKAEDAEAIRMKYSTTSSVYLEYSLTNPRNNEVAYCIGALIQAQIFDDSDCPQMPRDVHPEFDMEVVLEGKLGGHIDKIPEHILAHETLNDTELRDKLLSGHVPTVDSIYRFISYLHLSANFSSQCNIIALIYLNRMTGNKSHRFALTPSNWRGIWVVCVILAQKVMDDTPLKTSSFTTLLPNVTKMQLRDAEVQGFCLLEGGGGAIVKPSVYAKYYFELRALFLDIVGADKRYDWNLRPMTMLQGVIMEDRSTRASEAAKLALAHKQSTSTPLSRTPMMAQAKTPSGVDIEKAWGEGGDGVGGTLKRSGSLGELKDAKDGGVGASGSVGSVRNKVAASVRKTPSTPSRTLEDVTFTSPSTRYVLS